MLLMDVHRKNFLPISTALWPSLGIWNPTWNQLAKHRSWLCAPARVGQGGEDEEEIYGHLASGRFTKMGICYHIRREFSWWAAKWPQPIGRN